MKVPHTTERNRIDDAGGRRIADNLGCCAGLGGRVGGKHGLTLVLNPDLAGLVIAKLRNTNTSNADKLAASCVVFDDVDAAPAAIGRRVRYDINAGDGDSLGRSRWSVSGRHFVGDIRACFSGGLLTLACNVSISAAARKGACSQNGKQCFHVLSIATRHPGWLSGWRLGLGRLLALGGKLWPDALPVVGAQFLAGNLAIGRLLNCRAVLGRNLAATVKPVPDVLLLYAHLCSEGSLATSDRDCVFECFHSTHRTTFVLRWQTFVVRPKQRML